MTTHSRKGERVRATLKSAYFFLAAVLLFTLLAPTQAFAQNCPAGRYCYYAPPSMPTPTGFTVGWDMVLSTPGPTITGRYSFNAGASFTNFTVTLGSPQVVVLSAAQGAASNYGAVETRGIYIEADSADLTFEHRLIQGPWQSSETIKNNTIALGTRFRAGGYALSDVNTANTGHDYVAIYAPFGGTVTLNPPNRPALTANLPYWADVVNLTGVATLTLTPGQTVLVRTLPQSNVGITQVPEIDGALITSTMPITVSSGGRGWGGGCGDDGADNLLPVTQLGTQFVVDDFPSSNPWEPVRIVADTDGTQVRINGTLVTTLAAGGVYQTPAAGNIALSNIVTSAPAYVFQNAGLTACETDIAMIPPVAFMGRTASTSAAFNIVGGGRTAMLVESSVVASIRLDGAVPPGMVSAVVPGAVPALTMVHFNMGDSTTATSANHQITALGDFQLGVVTATPGTGLYGFYNLYRRPGCGDTVLQAGEGCDDGNTSDGDGCSSTCLIEIGFNGCSGNDALCVPAGRCATNTCRARCRADTDCNDANVCTTDACNLGTGICSNTALLDGASCTASSGSAGVCFNPTAMPPQCVQCVSNAQCSGATPTCNTSTHLCRACAVATQGTDCAAGTVCNSAAGTCVAPAVALVNPAASSLQSSTPTISGTATPGQTVTVLVDGMTLGTTTADASGNWSFPWPTGRMGLTNGAHRASATVPNGSATVTAGPNSFTVGCRASADCMGSTPVCNTTTSTCVQCLGNADCSGGTPICGTGNTCRACAPAGSASSMDCTTTSAPYCSGMGATSGRCVSAPPVVLTPTDGSSTRNGRPPVTGTAAPGAMVAVFLDGVLAGMTTADASGNWTFTPSTTLMPGMHSASAANVAGGVTGPRGNSNGFTVTNCTSNTDCGGTAPICDSSSRLCRPCDPAMTMDCSAPRPLCSTTGTTAGMCVATAVTITTPADGSMTGSRRPDIRGVAAPGSTVSIQVDGMEVGRVMADGNGDFTFTPTMDLNLGNHTVAGAPVLSGGTDGGASDAGTLGMPGPANRFTVTTCSSNAECSGGTPICDGTTRSCRGCNPANAMDCPDPTRPVCATAGVDTGRCVARVPTVTTPADGSTVTSMRPAITGTGTPGAMVVVRIDGVEVGRATVDASGNWTLTPTREVPLGMHTVDAANVQSDGSLGTPGMANRFTVAQCTGDSDCSAGNRCDTLQGRCVPAADGGTDGAIEGGMDGSSDASRESGSDGASADGSVPPARLSGAGTCGCSTPGGSGSSRSALGLALLGLALAASRRRRSA